MKLSKLHPLDEQWRVWIRVSQVFLKTTSTELLKCLFAEWSFCLQEDFYIFCNFKMILICMNMFIMPLTDTLTPDSACTHTFIHFLCCVWTVREVEMINPQILTCDWTLLSTSATMCVTSGLMTSSSSPSYVILAKERWHFTTQHSVNIHREVLQRELTDRTLWS